MGGEPELRGALEQNVARPATHGVWADSRTAVVRTPGADRLRSDAERGAAGASRPSSRRVAIRSAAAAAPTATPACFAPRESSRADVQVVGVGRGQRRGLCGK